MNILIVVTSHSDLGDTGQKTGLWLEEFVTPYYQFLDAGAEVTVASPRGGKPPIDPRSEEEEALTGMTQRFKEDKNAQEALGHTVKLADVSAADYDGVFYPGGHGPLWDLAEDEDSIHLIEDFYQSRKPVAAVCHGPGVFRHVMIDNESIVKNKRVTGFSNSEEETVKLVDVVPFLVEDELTRLGGIYEKTSDWKSFSLVDDILITGQNPASAKDVAQHLIKLISAKEKSTPGTLDSLGDGRISMSP